MRENLVPTVVTDRNWRKTTVYKKPITNDHVSRLAATLMPTTHKEPERLLRILTTVLRCYPEELLTEIEETLAEQPTTLFKIRGMVRERRSATRVRECLMFLRLGVTHPMMVEGHIAALRHYDQIPDSRDYSQEDERTKEIVSAVFLFTSILDNTMTSFDDPPLTTAGMGESFPIIRDERLVDLIVAHPEKAPEMAEFIIARRNGDYDLVRQMVEDTLPLSDGVL